VVTGGVGGVVGGGTVVGAAVEHDIPVIVGASVYFCALVIAVNLLIDVIFALVNPKIRLAS